MDEKQRMQLEAAGISVDAALERFLGNSALVLKFVMRFPEDENFPNLKRAMDCGDVKGAFVAAHTLKGVTGNLSMDKLYETVSKMVEDLREGNLDAAAVRMEELEKQYAQTIQALEAMR